jgi:hypothetical protein
LAHQSVRDPPAARRAASPALACPQRGVSETYEILRRPNDRVPTSYGVDDLWVLR